MSYKIKLFLLWLIILSFPHTAQAGKVTYVYTDPQGTILAEADASGRIIAQYDYKPYGMQTMGQATNGPGYTGHVNDPEAGLVYMQRRYYDPQTGRLLSIDPVAPAPGNLFGFNRYAYAYNNPIAHIDPTGECPDKNPCAEAIPYNFFRDNPGGSIIGHIVGDPIAIFTDGNINPLTNQGLMPGQVQDAKLGVVTTALSLAVAPELALGKSATSVSQEVKLTAEQAKNISRFESKVPANARGSVTIRPLPNNGVAAQATSPGRVPGSSAVYEKQIDATGKTVQYTKTTYDPNGDIVHVKDKITGQTIP